MKDMPRPLLAAFVERAMAWKTRLERELDAVGLTHTLFVTLDQLAHASRPLTQRELAEGQCCAPSNITHKIDRLEAEGLVRRVDDPDDRRVIRATLTPLGRQRAAAGARIVRQLEREFEAALSGAEHATLTRVLRSTKERKPA